MPLLPVKVVCGCGQKYSFDVEPVNGRMPSRVACPVCGVDGTGAANEILARSQAVPPPPPPRPAPTLAAAPAPALAPAPFAPAPVPVGAARMPGPPPAAAPIAPLAPATPRPPAETGVQRLAREIRAHTGEEEEDKWKWWYYILAGICIGGYSIWQFYNTHRPKVLGELFLAVLCICIGVWDFQRKRKKQQ
jgi:hypothetical protein